MMVSEYGNNKANQKLDINSVVDFVGSRGLLHGRTQPVFWPRAFEE